MVEGWNDEDYLILFAEEEIAAASERYAIAQWLPGYQVKGLRGWDDFILRDGDGKTYFVPTVPVDAKYLEPFEMPDGVPLLESDDRFQSKIKWYIQPLVFGGDPREGENLTWVSHEQHTQLVQWWNELYRSQLRQSPLK